MAKILSKYSQANNLQVEYTNQKEYMDTLAAQQVSATQMQEDYRTPFTFIEWRNRNTGLIPGQEYKQYNEYLKSWYANTYVTSDTLVNLREDYISLLEELKVSFKTEEDYNWFKNIDVTNDMELEDAIPYFAKKLKEVAIYIVNKRDAIKKAKLKYNMSGANNAIQKLFYEYLLKAFTKRDYILNVPEQSAYDTFPELSAVSDGFQIIVQDLYDDTSYFDKDPSTPVSGYYDLTDINTIDYLNTKTFPVSDMSWLLGTGINPLCANNPLIWMLSDMIATLPLSDFELPDRAKLNDYNRIDLTKKYIGTDQYYISGGYYLLDSDDYVYDLQQGNNWMYWPSGEYVREVRADKIYVPIMLTATNLMTDGTSASDNYRYADKIFVQDTNSSQINGAWAKIQSHTTQSVVMSALIPKQTNGMTFRFPYPGFGVIGEGLPWNGPQLENLDSTYMYLEDDVQKEVQDMYWSLTGMASSFDPLAINDTNLIDNGAIPAQEYHLSDKITLRMASNADKIHDSNPNNIYQEGFDRAWLYKTEKTDIPIKVGQSYVHWPLEVYQQNTSTALTIPSSQCTPMPLKYINTERDLVGARAGHSMFDSDIIYKLDSMGGYPIEAAVLSGHELSELATVSSTIMYNATGIIQPSFTLRVRPGNYERFVWQDTTTYIDQTSITHKNHQIDCVYTQNKHNSIFNTRGKTLEELNQIEYGLGDWNSCTCRAIKYNPCGHPGTVYSDYDAMADIIFIDYQFPGEFDITTWRDSMGRGYSTSPDFAFYRLSGNNPYETDIGWGTGYWKTGDNSRFQLKTGIVYRYLRANLRRNPADLIVNAVPDLIIKQKHNRSDKKTTWMKAIVDNTGNWVNSNSATDMILNPGDFIMYDHVDSNWYCLSSIGTRGQVITYPPFSSNVGNSLWTNITYATTGLKSYLKWPTDIHSNGPQHIRSELLTVTWFITSPTTTYTIANIEPNNVITLELDSVGTYNIQASGIGDFGTEYITNIPSLSVVVPSRVISLSGDLQITTTYNDRVGFTINSPLTGWNYTSHTYDGLSIGGRPFWAKAYDDDSRQTKFKGAREWGGGIRTAVIDDYTFVTQPDFATLTLSANSVINYDRQSSELLWNQPIDILVNESQKTWCKLIIDNSIVSPLSTYMYNISTEMIISAVDAISDIILSQGKNGVLINYWANNAFTWTQNLTNETLGFPPTGGIWVPIVSGSLVDAVVPYANLSNRHFPTIATMPYVGGLYSDEQSGGYFTPKNLGASVYVGSKYTNVIDTSKINNDPSTRGNTFIFRNPEMYTSDRGLSETTQTSPICTADIDSRWMKANTTEGEKAGNIINAKTYQKFIPYQSKYETIHTNFDGLRLQNDEYDPWTGSSDKIWSDPAKFPLSFRGEFPIEDWYSSNSIPQDKFIYQWKTDIFGNQYALLKDKTINSLYALDQAPGELWARDKRGYVTPGSVLLSGVYESLYFVSPQVSAEIVNNQIKDIDLWFDTLMIETSSNVIIQKLNFNYDTGEIHSIVNTVRVIDLSGGKFGGVWFFDEEKSVTLTTLISSRTQPGVVYPQIYSLELDTTDLVKEFDGYNVSQMNQISTVGLTSVEDPVFTYNNITKTYNMSFIGHTPLYNSIVVNSINILDLDLQDKIIGVYSVLPLK